MKDIVAVHEAGHAVVAALLHLPFEYVEIYDEAVPLEDGYVGGQVCLKFSHPKTVRCFVRRGEEYIPRTEDDLRKAYAKKAKKYIVMYFAGMAAVRHFPAVSEAEILEGGTKDLEQIRDWKADAGLTDLDVEQCKRKAESLVHKHFLGIGWVAKLLAEKKRLTSREVRKNILMCWNTRNSARWS
jgi:hypothetical protein